MKAEEIKLIAESVFPEYEHCIEQKVVLINVSNSQPYWIEFNPLTDDADAFKVLEALMVEFRDIEIHFTAQKFYVEIQGYDVPDSQSKNLREAICLAYLSLIKTGNNSTLEL